MPRSLIRTSYLNINGGLQSKLKGGELDEVMVNNDIVMFCESMTCESSDLCVKGFAEPVCIYRKRKKGSKSFSGGIVCFFRENIAHGVSVVDWSFEDGICLKLCKHVFKMNNDVFLLCVYMRSTGSTREDINDTVNCYDVLCDQVARICKQGDVVIVGDYNARTGVKADCLIGGVNESDMSKAHECLNPAYDLECSNSRKICIDDLVTNGMTVERVNEDKTTNEYGSRLVQMCMTV